MSAFLLETSSMALAVATAAEVVKNKAWSAGISGLTNMLMYRPVFDGE